MQRSENNRKKKILIISHNEPTRVFVAELLRSNTSYEINTVEDGERGLSRAMRDSPDLVILDMLMPGVDGNQLCRMLRPDANTHVPIILLSPRNGSFSTPQSQSDHVPTSHFDPMTLTARVERVLKNQRSTCKNNPFIRLSGHIRLGQTLARFSQFAVGYVNLDNLTFFNDRYGSTKGDQVIGHTHQIINDALTTFGTPHDFIKHVAADDFVFVTIPEKIEQICRHIIERFDREILDYCVNTDPLRGKDCDTTQQSFPPVNLSIAVVTNQRQEFPDFSEIGEVAIELRKYLKTLPGSNYYINRRHR